MSKIDDLKKFAERKKAQLDSIAQKYKKFQGERKASEIRRLKKERIRLEGEAQLADIRYKEQKRIESARKRIESTRPKPKPMTYGDMFGGGSDLFGSMSKGSSSKKKKGGSIFDI